MAALLVVSLLLRCSRPSVGPRGEQHEYGTLLRELHTARVGGNCKLGRSEARRGYICPIIAGVQYHSDLRASGADTRVVGNKVWDPFIRVDQLGIEVTLDLQTHLEAMLNHWWVQPSDIPWEEGIMRWASQRGNKFEAPGWQQAAQCDQLRLNPTLQVRLQQ